MILTYTKSHLKSATEPLPLPKCSAVSLRGPETDLSVSLALSVVLIHSSLFPQC